MPIFFSDFINAEVFKKCKKGVKIVNVGRGGLIKEADLLAALNSGVVSPSVVFVFCREMRDNEVVILRRVVSMDGL